METAKNLIVKSKIGIWNFKLFQKYYNRQPAPPLTFERKSDFWKMGELKSFFLEKTYMKWYNEKQI